MARRWREFPGRAAHALNVAGGAVALGGIAIGVGGLAVLTGPIGLVIVGLGGLTVVGAASYATYHGIPPTLTPATELLGKVVPPANLAEAWPPIPKLAIIGLGQVGKTTLRNRLAFDASSVDRTQEISAYVVALSTSPPKYLAVLDGRGDMFSQQFTLAQACDWLCVVVDHNESHSEISIDPDRVLEHQEFFKQLKGHFDNQKIPEKPWVHVLINKHDLWSRAAKTAQEQLVRTFTDEAEGWRSQKRAHAAECQTHSNNVASDITRFGNLLKSH